MEDEWYTLPNGARVVTRIIYTHLEARGPLALVVTASISLCAVVAILVAMAISGFKTRHRFVRSQVGAYFLSLVISDLLQAAGSVMNVKWVLIQGVNTGPFCTTQAALKQSGNVGTALWSLVIAIHTFCLLFLRLRTGDYVFYTTLIGVWIFIVFIVMLGPVILQTSASGPYWGISGYWCWITDGYHVEQLTEEYLFMFLAAGTSFVLYTLIFFRLRGNLHGFGWSLRWRRVKQPWIEDDTDESQMSTAGKQMLWYPVAYTIIISPIAVCRWSAIFGHEVPYWATIAADSIFMLSGFVNAILYSTTRKIVSVRPILNFSQLIRIGHSRRRWEKRHATSKSHLDTMEFAIPMSPCKDKYDTCRSSIASVTSPRLWHSQSGTVTDYIHEDKFVASDLWRIRTLGASERSDPGKFPQDSTENRAVLDIAPIPPAAASPSDDHTSLSYPHSDARVSLSRGLPQNPTVAELYSDVPGASETSLTTDGAPSSHHKRFSGWSLPSIRRGHDSSGDQESTYTDLEEMQFAPPSPEPARKRLPPLSSSPGDVQNSESPPRDDPPG